jgi:hypothetical protein
VRRSDDWSASTTPTAQSEVNLPFDTYHRNDQPEPVRIATRDRAPAVLAETGNGFVVLLSTADLTACGGLPDALVAAVILAAETNRLDWP